MGLDGTLQKVEIEHFQHAQDGKGYVIEFLARYDKFTMGSGCQLAVEESGNYRVQWETVNYPPISFVIRRGLVPPAASAFPQSAAGAPTPGPVVERNPEVLRIRLSQAEAELARLKQLYAAKLVTEQDLEAAQEKAAVLKAELEGDDVGVAQARLAAAKRAWERVSQLAKAKIVTTSEADAAQTEVQVREVELKAAQAAHTNAGPKMQINQTNRN